MQGVNKVVISTQQEFKVQEMFAGIFYNCYSHIKVFLNNPSIFQGISPVIGSARALNIEVLKIRATR